LRSDSSPSSSGTVSEVKAQTRLNHKEALHSLAIKPDKMRERGGGVGGPGKKEEHQKRLGEEQNQGEFWSINQQHLVLLPPLSSS